MHVAVYQAGDPYDDLGMHEGRVVWDEFRALADSSQIIPSLHQIAFRHMSGFHDSVHAAFTSPDGRPRFDVLIFLAPMLDENVYFLCHSRLAAIQVAHWAGGADVGLGEGVGAIDYFVSSEISMGDFFASQVEQIVRFPGTGVMLPLQMPDLPLEEAADVFLRHVKRVLYSTDFGDAPPAIELRRKEEAVERLLEHDVLRRCGGKIGQVIATAKRVDKSLPSLDSLL